MTREIFPFFFLGFVLGVLVTAVWMEDSLTYWKKQTLSYQHELEHSACDHCQYQKKWEKDFDDKK